MATLNTTTRTVPKKYRNGRIYPGAGLVTSSVSTIQGADADPVGYTAGDGLYMIGKEFIVNFDDNTIGLDYVNYLAVKPESITNGYLGDLSVSTGKIQADAVTGTRIADDVVDTQHFAVGAVDTLAIQNDAITGQKIADDQIDSQHYADRSIDSIHIAAEAVTKTELGNESVDTAQLADDAVTAAKIDNYTITAVKLAQPAVSTLQLYDDGVTGAKIADDAIDSNHYVDGSIDAAHLAADCWNKNLYASAIVLTNGTYSAQSVENCHFLILNTGSGDITIQGLSNGYAGQVIYCLKAADGNDLTIEHNSSSAASGDKIYTITEADETVSAGYYRAFQIMYYGGLWHVFNNLV